MTTTQRENRRVMRVAINYETLIRAIRGEIRITHDELPGDAEIINVFHDPTANAIGVVLEHESFPGVPFGMTTPIFFNAQVEELGPRCEQLHVVLLLVERQLTVEQFEFWTIQERKQALDYAWNLHLHASDHDDVPVPPMPPHVAKLPHPDDVLLVHKTQVARIVGYLRMMAKGDTAADPDALQLLIAQLAGEV